MYLYLYTYIYVAPIKSLIWNSFHSLTFLSASTSNPMVYPLSSVGSVYISHSIQQAPSSAKKNTSTFNLSQRLGKKRPPLSTSQPSHQHGLNFKAGDEDWTCKRVWLMALSFGSSNLGNSLEIMFQTHFAHHQSKGDRNRCFWNWRGQASFHVSPVEVLWRHKFSRRISYAYLWYGVLGSLGNLILGLTFIMPTTAL